MRLVFAFAVVMAARAAYGWLELGAVMVPDFSLYTQGGLGLFPSPVGRLLGALGPDVFAWLSIAGAALVVLEVGLLARARGGLPAVAALSLLLSPAALYLGYAGVDPIALALMGAALVLLHRPVRAVAFRSGAGGGRSGILLLGLAGLTHLSLVPFALVGLARRTTAPARWALAFVLLCSALALALTPYQAVLWLWLDWQAVPVAAVGLAAGVGLSLPGLLLSRPTALWWFAMLVGTVECAMQVHVQARYFLPAAMLSGVGPLRAWLAVSLHGLSLRLRSSRQAALRLKDAGTAVHDHRGSYRWGMSPKSARAVTAAVNVRTTSDTDAMPKRMKPALDTPAPNSSDASDPRRAYYRA